MKRFFFGTLLFVFTACTSEPKPLVEFDFKENLAVSYNTATDIGVKILDNSVQSIEIYLDNELQQKYDNPGEYVKLTLNTKEIGLGTKAFMIKAVSKSGEEFTESRLLRVLSDLTPEKMFFEVEESFPHNVANFTQGLEFYNGELYESTGQLGASKVSTIDISTGKDKMFKGISDEHFGEGITVLNDTLYQLTWQTGFCFLYNAKDLSILRKDFKFQGEGWGITNNGKEIIMSNGTERLYFRDPKTFEIIRTMEVFTNDGPVNRLNELEYVDGIIYANVWMTNSIVAIEAETGRVLGILDASSLAKIGRGRIGEAFNGIAYNKEQDAFYVTGKQWEKLFKLKLIKDKSLS